MAEVSGRGDGFGLSYFGRWLASGFDLLFSENRAGAGGCELAGDRDLARRTPGALPFGRLRASEDAVAEALGDPIPERCWWIDRRDRWTLHGNSALGLRPLLSFENGVRTEDQNKAVLQIRLAVDFLCLLRFLVA